MSVHTTVVFTDLIGSTSAFEVLGNVEATQTITQITRTIRDIFESHGGSVVKTLGDGVLAVFPNVSHAIGAVVQMQRGHQKWLAQQPVSHSMPIRVGVATGEVEIVDGDCYGDAVNVASRLNDLCGPNEIWVNSSEIDSSARSDNAKFRPLGVFHVRGRGEPCTVYQVEWNEDDTSDFMTKQAIYDLQELAELGDCLGAEITFTWMDNSKSFKSFELPVHIGRSHSSELVVNDPRVSRTHARIEWRNGRIMFIDVSSYGSWVRFEGSSSDVLLRREECALHGHGVLVLGGSSFADATVPVLHFAVR